MDIKVPIFTKSGGVSRLVILYNTNSDLPSIKSIDI